MIDDEFGVLRKILLTPGVLDVLPATGHPVGKPVLMLRVKYQGQSCLLMPACHSCSHEGDDRFNA